MLMTHRRAQFRRMQSQPFTARILNASATMAALWATDPLPCKCFGTQVAVVDGRAYAVGGVHEGGASALRVVALDSHSRRAAPVRLQGDVPPNLIGAQWQSCRYCAAPHGSRRGGHRGGAGHGVGGMAGDVFVFGGEREESMHDAHDVQPHLWRMEVEGDAMRCTIVVRVAAVQVQHTRAADNSEAAARARRAAALPAQIPRLRSARQ